MTTSTTAIEMVSYKLKEYATKEALAVQYQPLNEFLKEQDGFMYRSLVKESDNSMLDIIYWRDMAAAQKAGETFMASPICQRVAEIADMESVVVKHFKVLSEEMICEETA